jgi:hypothetical protein
MLSIPGTTLSEVFANLATRTELNTTERQAALILANWLDRYEQVKRRQAEACQKGDHTGWQLASHDEWHLLDVRPYGGTGLHPSNFQEWRTFIVGRVKFRVQPYTTGATMNVGIDPRD